MGGSGPGRFCDRAGFVRARVAGHSYPRSGASTATRRGCADHSACGGDLIAVARSSKVESL